MNANLQSQILEALKDRPGQKADQLANALGSSRTEVNRLLYGPLKGKVIQDRSYRWSLATPSSGAAGKGQAEPVEQFANTDLARLCRYYLACLGYDETGVSTFLTSKNGDPDYFEVNTLPQSSEDLSETEAARWVLGRQRTERGRYGLYFGYPTSIQEVQSRRSGWRGFTVEPILLFPIEQDKDSGKLTIDLRFPIINQRPFQAFTNVEREMLMNELVELEQELGLTADEGRPEVDEVAMRLQAIRREWPWREEIDPSQLGMPRMPMAKLNQAGIYNRAVIMIAEKSPFTLGLERELRDLAQLQEADYRDTALGNWLLTSHATKTTGPALTKPLIEVLPMNLEQRGAVQAALTNPLTIITGPPGTGKSQVVTNLLVNAAWMGKRVLFASKNNKAVDVVETRVNVLGSRPILLRLGAQHYQVRLAEYILNLASATSTQADQEEFAEAKAYHEQLLAKHAKFAEYTQAFIELRNSLDRLEQEAEEEREALGPNLFARSGEINIMAVKEAVQSVAAAMQAADKNNAGALTRLFWSLHRKNRFAALSRTLAAARPVLTAIDIPAPANAAQDADIAALKASLQTVESTLSALTKAAAYKSALQKLQTATPLEEVARAEAELQGELARHSETLWKLWLRIQPSLMSAADRKRLGQYTALLKMVMEAGDDGQLNRQVYGKYNAMLNDISHLMPCWAVTSLSARGRIPFAPNVFDLVIFDEASQCDIASALPLLFRAKSVVVIGDPKQLAHISGLPRGQDQSLLERFGLLNDFPEWSYAHQSLFGLASTQLSGSSIVSLVDHHRSHADIIQFSNNEFYEERLRVATKYDALKSPNRSEPGIRWVDVKGQVTRPGNGGAVNEVEANFVVYTLRDLVLNKGYRGTVGVVTPFRAQANAITRLVNQEDELASALIQRGFLADTVHRFQGDERDVMIFSPVVSAGLPAGSLGFLRSNGNLFNVAITRARAQLIVVGDQIACAASDIGYLARFSQYVASLAYSQNADIDSQLVHYGPTYPLVAQPDLVSDWERIFYVAAYETGFRLIPQYPIEKYIVDFLLIEGGRKLVIEIDGERYHRNWTGELCRRDQIRNQRLFELGYDVMRFWVYEVRDNIKGCFERINHWRNQEPVSDKVLL